MGGNWMDSLFLVNTARRCRVSSWDTSGGNRDWITIGRGETKVIADLAGAGYVRHIWMTVNCADSYYLRKLLLRIWWDQEETPSVLVPLGDFFGVGHGVASHYSCVAFNMIARQDSPQKHAAMNCFLPMPFQNGARFEIVNEAEEAVKAFYFYIDYDSCEEIPQHAMRFHSCWHREKTPQGNPEARDMTWTDFRNLTGEGNYVLLDAKGQGTYIGCNVSIDHTNPIEKTSWFGEGDDMIFIDEEPWPPRLHGTGTEDYFGAAWGYPSGKYDALYHGISLAAPIHGFLQEDPWAMQEGDGTDFWYSGKWTFYRHHLPDPVPFRTSIRVTLERGHANCHGSDFSSTAYWYQTEPHVPLEMLPVQERLPLSTVESLKGYVKTI